MLKGVVVKKSEWFLLDDMGILFHVLKYFWKSSKLQKREE